jgi:2-hydroxy-6-oxonona-2,4-dienedioate hydrolase
MTSAGSSAPPQHLLLLHGMLGNPGQWDASSRAASHDWNVMSPDLPLLEVDPGNSAIDQLAARMVHLMDRAGMDRAVVGGNSLGGHIATRMALRYPDRVSGLVLTGSSGLFERGMEKSVPRRPTEDYIRHKMRDVFYAPGHCTTELIRHVHGVLSDLRRVVRILRIAACAKRDSLRDLLPAVTCPALLVWGRDDLVTPPSAAVEFERLLPDARLHFLAECGHVPMVEQPEAFNTLMMEFLSRVSGAATRTREISPHHPAAPLQYSCA